MQAEVGSKPVRLRVWESLTRSFHHSDTKDDSGKDTNVRIVTARIWWVLQMTALLDPESQPANDMGEGSVWAAICYLRPDGLSAAFSQSQLWALACCGAVCLSCILLFPLAIQPNTERWKPVRTVFLRVCQWLAGMMLVPCSNGLLGGLFPQRRINVGWSKEIGEWGIYVLPPIYVAFLGIVSLTVLFTFELDYSISRNSGKSEILDDYLTILSVQILTFSYYLLSPSVYPAHLAVTLCLMALGTYRTLVCLPHYSPLTNAAVVWARGALLSIACSLLICELISTRLSGLLLSGGLSVSWAVILYQTFGRYEQQRLEAAYSKLQSATSASDVELGIRPLLHTVYFSHGNIRREKATEAQDLINSFLFRLPNAPRSRLMLIKHFLWKHVFENGSAALLCVAKAQETAVTVADTVLSIKYHALLTRTSQFTEIVYLQFLRIIEDVKNRDEQLCVLLADLWTELAASQPNFPRIIRLSKIAHREVAHIKHGFEQITKQFPCGFEVYDFYASFLREVLNDESSAGVWRLKANMSLGYSRKATAREDDAQVVDFFDAATAVVLADLHPSNFLSIIYLNRAAEIALSYDAKVAQVSKLTGLIPPPYSALHSKYITSFLAYGAKAEIAHPHFMPLMTAKGFIVFCTARIMLTAYGGRPVLLFGFKVLTCLKEGAVISEKMVIEAHSEEFSRMIGAGSERLSGVALGDARKSLIRREIPSGNPHCFPLFQQLPFVGSFVTLNYSLRPVHFFLTFPQSTNYPESDFHHFTSTVLHSHSDPDDQQLHADVNPEEMKQLLGSVNCPEEAESHAERIRDTRRVSVCVRTAGKRPSAPPLNLKSNTSESTVHSPISLSLNRQIPRTYKMIQYSSIYTVKVTQVCFLIILNIVSVVVIKHQTTAIANEGMISEVAAREIYVGKMAICARLAEMDFPQATKVQLLRDLADYSALIRDTNARLWEDVYDSSMPQYRGYISDKHVIVWELINGQVSYQKVTLVDAVQKLLEASERVLAAEVDSIPHAAVFYLYRNGLGETYQELAKVKEILLTTQKNHIEESIGMYYVYVLAAFGIMAISTILLLILLIHLQRTARSLSSALLLRSIPQYYQEKQRITDHLQVRYSLEVDLSLENHFKGQRRPALIYRPVVRFCTAVVLYWVIWGFCYLYFYLKICTEITNEMQKEPIVLANDANRLVNVIEADAWVSDYYQSALAPSLTQYIPQFTLVPSVKLRLRSVLTNIKVANIILLDEVLNGFKITNRHFDFLYRSTNFTSNLYTQGYRVGTKAYLNEVQYCANTADKDCDFVLKTLYDTSEELARSADFIGEHYREDCRVMLQHTLDEMIGFFIGFSGCLIVGLALFQVFVNRYLYWTSWALWGLVATMERANIRGQTVKETSVVFTSK